MMTPLPARPLDKGRRGTLGRHADNQPVRSPDIRIPPPGGTVEVLELFPGTPAEADAGKEAQ